MRSIAIALFLTIAAGAVEPGDSRFHQAALTPEAAAEEKEAGEAHLRKESADIAAARSPQERLAGLEACVVACREQVAVARARIADDRRAGGTPSGEHYAVELARAERDLADTIEQRNQLHAQIELSGKGFAVKPEPKTGSGRKTPKPPNPNHDPK